MALKVVYSAALPDLSGYAQAARGYVYSLDSVGLEVCADPRTFEPWRPQYLVGDVMSRRLYSLIGRDRTGAQAHIIHHTPDLYHEYQASGRVKVGYFAWETSRLPPKWVHNLNAYVKETWVPCAYLKKVSEESGVTIPVWILPHAIPLPEQDWKPASSIKGLPEDRFKFYSVFQWSERKNPCGLIRAYYQEFSRDERVVLVLKTYRAGDDPDRSFIRKEIAALRKATKGNDCPPILLIEEFLSPAEISALHHYCDCYVCMSRSEGFGIPAMEAAAFGNAVVVPRYSSYPEYLDESNAYFVDVPREVPVAGMKYISLLYTGDMLWGDPSVESCQRRMREVFSNQEEAKKKGERARNYVKHFLSYKAIGGMMKNRLVQLI
jgi:glycosyltransferase involved in cell wall biosynthesis